MAIYKIIENPGKREVDVDEELGSPQGKIDNQDKAKIVVRQLRVKAKREGRQVDYVIVTQKAAREGSSPVNSSGGTSIRLTEEQRQALAKIVGYHMWQTGQTISMGEALVMILEENRSLKRRLAERTEDDGDADDA